jgi:hypothetical protein
MSRVQVNLLLGQLPALKDRSGRQRRSAPRRRGTVAFPEACGVCMRVCMWGSAGVHVGVHAGVHAGAYI